MHEDEVIQKINNAIKMGQKKALQNNNERIYTKSIEFLQEMKSIVENDEQPKSSQPPSTSLGLFSVHDIEPADPIYASTLSKATFAFDLYYDLIDPDLLQIMKEKGDI